MGLMTPERLSVFYRERLHYWSRRRGLSGGSLGEGGRPVRSATHGTDAERCWHSDCAYCPASSPVTAHQMTDDYADVGAPKQRWPWV